MTTIGSESWIRIVAGNSNGSVPGCGPWTVEITMGFVLGDPDAVPTGDPHLPHQVGQALAGEPGADDARMLELLEPFRGGRFRLLRLLLAARSGCMWTCLCCW